MKISHIFYCSVLLCLTLVLTGCARQEESPRNLQLIAALRTAVSAKNAEWLAKTKTSMEEAVKKAEMSDETAKSFQTIIQTAESGDWSAAEELVIDLQESRRPAGNAKGHDHSH